MVWGNGKIVIKEVKVEKIKDTNPDTYVRRAEDFIKKNQFTEALVAMDEAIDLAKSNTNHYLFQKFKIYEAIRKEPSCCNFIKSHIQTFYFDHSLDVFHRVIKVLAQNINQEKIAPLLHQNGIPAILATTFHEQKNTVDYFLDKAHVYYKNNSYSNAESCLSVINTKLYKTVDSIILEARIYQARSRTSSAISILKECANDTYANQEVFIELVNLLIKTNKKDQAITWINNALKKFSNERELLFLKAKILKEMNRSNEALFVLNNLLKNQPTDEQALFMKGQIHDEMGNYLFAALAFRKAKIINNQLNIPLNSNRSKFISRLKITLLLTPLVILLILAGQYIGFKIGIFEPHIYDIEIYMSDGDLLVNNSAGIEYSFKYSPSYAQEPIVTFETDDTQVASIEENRIITGLSEGATKVKMVFKDKVLESKNIRILDPTQNPMQLQFREPLIEVGDETYVTTVMNIDNDIIYLDTATYMSNNTDVAIVSEEGRVTVKGEGVTTITAKIGSYIAEEKITIDGKVLGINIGDLDINLQVGQSHTLQPTVSLAIGSLSYPPLSYSSDQPDIAVVEANGEILGKRNGTTKITISSPNGVQTSVNVTVKETLMQPQNLEANYDVIEERIKLEWDAPLADSSDVEYEVYVSFESSPYQLVTTTTENSGFISNPLYGGSYQFKVVTVRGKHASSDPATTTLDLPSEKWMDAIQSNQKEVNN